MRKASWICLREHVSIFRILVAISFVIVPEYISFSQRTYRLSFPFSYNSIKMPNESLTSLKGDTVYIDFQDFSAFEEIELFNQKLIPDVSWVSKKLMVIERAEYFIKKPTRNIAKGYGNYHIILKSLVHPFRIAINISDSINQLTQNKRDFIFIRKSIYDEFKNRLSLLVFDTDIHVNLNTVNCKTETQNTYDNFPFKNVSKLDSNNLKEYDLDSLSRGWKVKTVKIFGVEDIFQGPDSVSYGCECHDNSMLGDNSEGNICLLTQNYKGHTQIVSLYEENNHNFYSGIPTIRATKKYKVMYGKNNWLKSRLILYFYNSIEGDSNSVECSKLERVGYLEPVISGKKIAHFTYVTPKIFSIYYNYYKKYTLSLKQLYKNHFHLLSAYDSHFDQNIHSLSYILKIIRQNKRFQQIKATDRVTILQYHIIFGSSFTDFAFIGNSYFSDS